MLLLYLGLTSIRNRCRHQSIDVWTLVIFEDRALLSVPFGLAIPAPILCRPPVIGVALPAKSLVIFVSIYFPSICCSLNVLAVCEEIPLYSESAQYFVPCNVMLSWHNGLRQWNSDICDTFWLLVKP